MRKFLLLTSLLLTGCATVPLAQDVIDDCNAEYFGQYYGNCIWETYEFHPNKDSYIEAYNYKTDWLEITQLNNMLLYSLRQGNISAKDANILFMARFMELSNKDTARVLAQNAQWSEAMRKLGEINKDLYTNPNARGVDAPQRLNRTELKNNGKVCHYGFGITAKTLIVGIGGKCPDYL